MRRVAGIFPARSPQYLEKVTSLLSYLGPLGIVQENPIGGRVVPHSIGHYTLKEVSSCFTEDLQLTFPVYVWRLQLSAGCGFIEQFPEDLFLSFFSFPGPESPVGGKKQPTGRARGPGLQWALIKSQ